MKSFIAYLSAGLVFTVNVGGAWTPIGDITTTMLWISGKVETLPLMSHLCIPCLLSFLVFTALYSLTLPKEKTTLFPGSESAIPSGSQMVLWLGILGFISVPVMKITLGLPPFLGMLLSLGVIWLITDLFHKDLEERKRLKVEYILTRIDISCVLFFLGILLAIACLDASGILSQVAAATVRVSHNAYYFNFTLGLISSIIDNIPLVAAVIKMFNPETFPSNDTFWFLNAYCAGVGGSLLIIGSAPGVALMSLNDIGFLWYIKRVSAIAFFSYFIGWISIFFLSEIIYYMPSSG